MLVDGDVPPISSHQVTALAERAGRQRRQDRPLLLVQVEVGAGDLLGSGAEPYFVSQLVDNDTVGLAHLAQAEPRADHVAIDDVPGRAHAAWQACQQVAAFALYYCVLQRDGH